MEENKLIVTRYDVLGKLPDPLVFDDGTPVKTVDDWQKRRKEIYKYVVDLQYGTIPPEPDFLEVEKCMDYSRYATYRITTGRRNHPVSFMMHIFKPTPVPKNCYKIIIRSFLC